jgi:hypothetical protein
MYKIKEKHRRKIAFTSLEFKRRMMDFADFASSWRSLRLKKICSKKVFIPILQGSNEPRL